MERWAGRVALVTGASSGIGAAIACALVREGMKVVGCARGVDKIEALKESLCGCKGTLIPVKCDIRKTEDIATMFKMIDEQLGGLDVVINNAGVPQDAPLLSGDTEKWRQMLEVNVLGLCIVTREAFKSMRKKNVDDGQIIHISSYTGHKMVNFPAMSFYSGTKFMVRALLEALRYEIRATNTHIRVAEISPGMVETINFFTTLTGSEELANQMLSMFKVLKPEDIAEGVLTMLKAPAHVEIHEYIVLPTEQGTQFDKH